MRLLRVTFCHGRADMVSRVVLITARITLPTLFPFFCDIPESNTCSMCTANSFHSHTYWPLPPQPPLLCSLEKGHFRGFTGRSAAPGIYIHPRSRTSGCRRFLHRSCAEPLGKLNSQPFTSLESSFIVPSGSDQAAKEMELPKHLL